MCPCRAPTSSTGLKCRLCGKLYPKEADQLLHRRLRPARSRLRLRRRRRDASAARRSRRGRGHMWRYRELLPLDGEPTVGLHVGGTPADPGRPPGRGAGRRRAVDQERRGQLPDALVQGPRRRRGAVARPCEFGFKTVGCASTGNLANSVAANAAAAGLEAYILDPGRPGAGQDPRHQRSTAPRSSRVDGHLRPGQPPLLADRLQVRLGLRQRQPPAVLRRGVEDDGLRDRRGPRLAAPAPRRLPDGRRQPDRQDPQGVQGARRRSA